MPIAQNYLQRIRYSSYSGHPGLSPTTASSKVGGAEGGRVDHTSSNHDTHNRTMTFIPGYVLHSN